MEIDKIIIDAVFSAIDEINAVMPVQLERSLDTPLFGAEGKLDSIGLVTLLAAAEERLDDAFGKRITLADEKAMSRKQSPFLTVGSLAEYIAELVNHE